MLTKENERVADGAEEVRRLLDAAPFHVKATLVINGVEYGFGGSLAGLRHYLTVLEHTLS